MHSLDASSYSSKTAPEFSAYLKCKDEGQFKLKIKEENDSYEKNLDRFFKTGLIK